MRERVSVLEFFSTGMSKDMAWGLFPFLLLSWVCLTGGVEETDPAPSVLHNLSQTDPPVAALLSGLDLVEVSSSVLRAESWLKTHVLAHYPATRITTIVVGHNVFCNKDHAHTFHLILPSLKNMFLSLNRWGLEKDIKLSASFSSSCLNLESDSYREDLVESMKPVLTFLHDTNSSYSIDLSHKVSPLVASHYESMRKIGFSGLQMINVIEKVVEDPTSRKLISLEDSKFGKPYPARPTPLPDISPIHSSIGFSSPATVPKTPSPSASPPFPNLDPPQDPPFSATPPFSNSNPPEAATPSSEPARPPTFSPSMSPCSPAIPKAPKETSKFWCVAKPSVPDETLQVGMDYACGAGEADCEEIKPYGSCFNPDTVVAHASYAYNSYWQKHKKLGGSCSFGGTAMLINADPSFMHCRFVLI